MTDQQLIDKTAEFIKARMIGEGSGHDWWHVYRVWKLSQKIAEGEPEADRLTVELGALLHDIVDWKFADGSLDAGPQAAREWLEEQGADEALITHIEDIIRNTSFKGANVALNLKTIEAKIVSDADKLDAIGAIGIARTFAYGGNKNRQIYDPEVKPKLAKTFEEYKANQSHTINHFYEKLLLLKDIMQTKTAREIAQKRHDYMEQFLEEFYKEWDGQA